jgi:hypothetical protein
VSNGRPLGLNHETHPLIGRIVRDTGRGLEGVLRAVTREPVTTGRGEPGMVRKAWIAPRRGGLEWDTPVELIVAADSEPSGPTDCGTGTGTGSGEDGCRDE